ncbi:unnamed protein product [Cyprideis torosa]|uniref:Uncharacterized protein n=1 Tax=Cyprideis torosa TaxID=163714 RepID=A0A7R8W2F1_9CRUS|nr:unnamed protein product [Cyprideis torosa]CAG0881888.1 unnamed protein product [Cyprideis torosa]
MMVSLLCNPLELQSRTVRLRNEASLVEPGHGLDVAGNATRIYLVSLTVINKLLTVVRVTALPLLLNCLILAVHSAPLISRRSDQDLFDQEFDLYDFQEHARKTIDENFRLNDHLSSPTFSYDGYYNEPQQELDAPSSYGETAPIDPYYGGFDGGVRPASYQTQPDYKEEPYGYASYAIPPKEEESTDAPVYESSRLYRRTLPITDEASNPSASFSDSPLVASQSVVVEIPELPPSRLPLDKESSSSSHSSHQSRSSNSKSSQYDNYPPYGPFR